VRTRRLEHNKCHMHSDCIEKSSNQLPRKTLTDTHNLRSSCHVTNCRPLIYLKQDQPVLLHALPFFDLYTNTHNNTTLVDRSRNACTLLPFARASRLYMYEELLYDTPLLLPQLRIIDATLESEESYTLLQGTLLQAKNSNAQWTKAFGTHTPFIRLLTLLLLLQLLLLLSRCDSDYSCTEHCTANHRHACCCF
jgi:hypothetical protein